MRKIFFLFAIAVISIGCAIKQGDPVLGPGDFTITQEDNRFDAEKNIVLTSLNNRISTKAVSGGGYLNGHGIYINPMVIKSKTGKVINLNLQIQNYFSHDTMFGSPNSLGTLNKISFLVDNENPVVLPITGKNGQWSNNISYNSVLKAASAEVVESGFCDISIEQYKSIMTAKKLAVKLQGDKNTVIYENNDISEDFTKNLMAFFNKIK